MSKPDIAAKKQALIDAYEVAKNVAAVERTPDARRRAVDASDALSVFIVEHDPLKPRGSASRAGQRQAIERRAYEGVRRRQPTFADTRHFGNASAGPYRVQRLEPETILAQVHLSGGRVAGTKSPKRITYAVVDVHGTVVKKTAEVWDFTAQEYRTRVDYEIYPRRSAAQTAADLLNTGSTNDRR